MAFDAGLGEVLSRAAFDAEGEPACVLDAQGVVVAVNRAWDAFARANGGTGTALSDGLVGTPWLDAMAGAEPRRLAAEALRNALATAKHVQKDGGPIAEHHRLHCNAPLVMRGLDARFVPLVLEDGRVYVLVTYTTVVERPVSPVADGALEPFRTGDGLIRQCSGCRRVIEPLTGAYRFVPAFVESPPARVTHTICAICTDLWYGSGSWVDMD